MKKKIEILFRTDSQPADKVSQQESVENSQRFIYNKRAISFICKELCMESNHYKPKNTISYMENYLKSPEKIERILYSEISNYIFSLDTLSEQGDTRPEP
ncbi:MAG: hypothetical protein HFH48_03450 [Lachnospiraceae bacterium]|nr:hypothetical protein [Lachnospiraceae bacterium]